MLTDVIKIQNNVLAGINLEVWNMDTQQQFKNQASVAGDEVLKNTQKSNKERLKGEKQEIKNYFVIQ